MPEIDRNVARSPMRSCSMPSGVEKTTWPICEAIWKPTMYSVAESFGLKWSVK